jgi:hypothetical protein
VVLKRCAQKLREALQARDSGRLVVGSRQTVSQFLGHWLEQSAKASLRERTYERHENIIRNNIVPSFGRVPLTQLTPQHIQQLQNSLLDSGKAPRTVLKVRHVLGSALDQAEQWG